MKTNKKALVSALAMGGLMIATPASSVFATTVDNGQATVPAYLTAAATTIDVTIGTGYTIVDPTPESPNSGDEFVDYDGDGAKDNDEPSVVTPTGDDGTNSFIDYDGDGAKDDNEPLKSAFEADAVYMDVAANSNAGTVTSLKVTNNNTASPVYVSKISVTATSPYTKEAYDTAAFKTYAADSHKFALKMNGTTDLVNDYEPTDADKIEAEQTGSYTLEGLSSVVTEAVNKQKIGDVVITVSQN